MKSIQPRVFIYFFECQSSLSDEAEGGGIDVTSLSAVTWSMPAGVSVIRSLAGPTVRIPDWAGAHEMADPSLMSIAPENIYSPYLRNVIV